MALAWARVADVREVAQCECRVAVVSGNRRTFALAVGGLRERRLRGVWLPGLGRRVLENGCVAARR